MDCRDICANVMLLTDDDETNDTMGWIALALTGIGFIPVLGSAVKGVGKVVVKNPKESITLAAATLRKVGKGDPIKYIKEIDWQALGKQATALIKEKIVGIRDALDSKVANSSWLLSSAAVESLRKNSQKLTEILPKVEQGIKNAINLIEQKVNKALSDYQGELAHIGKTGDIKKVKTDEFKAPKGNELKGAQGKMTHPLLAKMKAYKVPCFKPSDNLRKKNKHDLKALEHNYARQLKHQENGLNDLSVGEYMENRQHYKDMKRKGTGSAQSDFRGKFKKRIEKSLEASYGKTKSRAEAKNSPNKGLLILWII